LVDSASTSARPVVVALGFFALRRGADGMSESYQYIGHRLITGALHHNHGTDHGLVQPLFHHGHITGVDLDAHAVPPCFHCRKRRTSRAAEWVNYGVPGEAEHADEPSRHFNPGTARDGPCETGLSRQSKTGRKASRTALANNPRVLLADEPTSQLDLETGRQIMRLLLTVVRSEGITALVATHDEALMDLADEILRLEDGQIAS
jgi:hypothetical protein